MLGVYFSSPESWKNEEREKNMETAIMGYMGIAIRIHSSPSPKP